ncbi:hypothetical protein HJG60_008761 [Phyllostomus discolor]|uniref:Uncharacterized protein n=1 Tax=Phyllostomus discolor TaxID=89673 RepID=A0A834DL30_9CHIR|nr:hypothetical protein HJG60_008761 [Phyllostomus discolor]
MQGCWPLWPDQQNIPREARALECIYSSNFQNVVKTEESKWKQKTWPAGLLFSTLPKLGPHSSKRGARGLAWGGVPQRPRDGSVGQTAAENSTICTSKYQGSGDLFLVWDLFSLTCLATSGIWEKSQLP